MLRGLSVGADDFLAKPVRIDELVARVSAHIRTQSAWSDVIAADIGARAAVMAALSRVPVSSVPEESAEAFVRELGGRIDADLVAVLQVGADDGLQELATYDRLSGARRGGDPLPWEAAKGVLERAHLGPWVEDVRSLASAQRTHAFNNAGIELAAGAPIFAGPDLVAILTIGIAREIGIAPQVRRARLLAAAIDYASALSTLAGPVFADRRQADSTRARLQGVLSGREFHPVFQPIVEVATRDTRGYEALTRFSDGTRPDLRFAEAARAGLGEAFEMATLEAAVAASIRLPDEVFLSLNISPELLLKSEAPFRELVEGSSRRLVLELTEHLPIDDYEQVRAALATYNDVGLAVDDAGAGYASLRHILELRPTFAKLDISLVRGIDGDDLRQSLAAGLQYFAMRTGCRLIAEGVETEGEAETLERLGVELAQGYLYGRPEPLA